jgi:hypothetical protein
VLRKALSAAALGVASVLMMSAAAQDRGLNERLASVEAESATVPADGRWLGREPINLPGGRDTRVRYAPIATNFRSAAK